MGSKTFDYTKIRADGFIIFLPVLIALIWLYNTNYYLVVMQGDPDYHLSRAREILESPLKGVFWDNLRCYPGGKAVNHQPLYHIITALLWKIGGVRFAFSVMAITQIIVTIGIVSFFGRRYGVVAGLTSGFLAFFTLRIDTLMVPTPSAFVFPLILLTIHFAFEKKKIAYAFFLAALWVHPVVIFVAPVIYYYCFLKNKDKLFDTFLAISWFFWIFYWTYFGLLKGQMGQQPIDFSLTVALTELKASMVYSLLTGYFTIFIVGLYGFYLLRRNKEAKIISLSTLILVLFTFIYGDYNRYPQYLIMPLAIFGGITIQNVYNEFSGQVKKPVFVPILYSILILILFLNVPNVIKSSIDEKLYQKDYTAAEFEFPNNDLKSFIEENTEKNEIVYADNALVDKIVWMTGRKVSNCGEFGSPRSFVPSEQRVNLQFIPVPEHIGEDKILFNSTIVK